MTVPVNSLVSPRFRPCSIRKVPSVMMKLGSPVRVTSQPLPKPIARASTSDAPMASQMSTPPWTATIPTVSAVVPVITPADRSKCPPIISSATATAMIPSVEATSSQLAIPLSERNTADCAEKNTRMTTAPMSEPSSGFTSSRRHRPTVATRSSARAGPRTGASGVALTACPGRSTGPRRGQVADRVHIAGVDDRRTGQHRLPATDGVQVLRVQLEHHDRQVALLVLLLVHGEGDRAVLDRLDHVTVEVEGGDLGVGPGVLGGGRSHRGHPGVQREDPVDRRV